MFSAIALVVLAVGCDGASGDGNAALVKRGSAVYDANCIACHAREPHKDGAVGPAVAGSSLALLEAKVLRNEYPPGYTPKRDSKAMIPLAHLEPDLAAIHAFLQNSTP
jgi:mono/diheme cytochrome c family protein